MTEFLLQVFWKTEAPKIFRVRGNEEQARQQATLYLLMAGGNAEKVDIYSPWKGSDSFSQAIDTIYYNKNL